MKIKEKYMIEIEEKVNKEEAADLREEEGPNFIINSIEEEDNIQKRGNIQMLIKKVREWKKKIIKIDIGINLQKIMIIFKQKTSMMEL
mmetsp:Transcript_16039/g.1436  ORF Transcript_16039/g.1436 Transcript_16039/m.1436 type:complete len:88 (+) Transcript_16039:21-284(+)